MYSDLIGAGVQSVLWHFLYTLLKKLKEHFDIMIFIERYPLKRCQGCVKLIASKVNCFLNINDLSEVQLCMSSNSWTWDCPHTKDGADHVPLIFLKIYKKGPSRHTLRLVKDTRYRPLHFMENHLWLWLVASEWVSKRNVRSLGTAYPMKCIPQVYIYPW